MAIPLRTLPIHAFLGDQESSESLTLAQVHSSGGSRNIWMDKFGNINPVLGYSKRNQTAVLSDTGHKMRIVGLHPFTLFREDPSGNDLEVINRLIGVFRGRVNGTGSAYIEIKHSLDGGITWVTLDAPFSVSNAPGFTDILGDSIPHFAQIGDVMVITGPSRVPLKYDGTQLFGLTTTAGLAAPTIADGGAGPLNGVYTWRVIDVLSDGTRGPARPPSGAYAYINKKATVTWAASTSPLIQAYEVYRTTGADTVYFLVGTVAAGTLSLSDAISDLDLIQAPALQAHGDSVPYAAQCVYHGNRMWYGNTFPVDTDNVKAYPRRWYYSDPGKPESVYLTKNYFDCSDGETSGDFSTGATGYFDDLLVIWLERSVWKISGTGERIGNVLDYELERTNARVGATTSRSVLRIPMGSVYTDQHAEFQKTPKALLAYFTPSLDIRLFDGNNDVIISYPKAKLLQRVTYNSRHRVTACLDDTRNEAIWLLPLDGEDQPSVALVWNYRHGVWYERTWPFACLTTYTTHDDALMLLAGEGDWDVGAFCYRLWDGRTTAGGASIESRWMSKSIYGPARQGEMESEGDTFSLDKRWRWLEALFSITAPTQIEVGWLLAEANDDDEPVALAIIEADDTPLLLSDGAALETSDGDVVTVTLVRQGVIRRERLLDENGDYFHGRGLRLRLRSLSTEQIIIAEEDDGGGEETPPAEEEEEGAAELPAPTSVERMVQAGGGSGGSSLAGWGGAGGGGAGGRIRDTWTVTAGVAYTGAVGDGGVARDVNTNLQGEDGDNSSLDTAIAIGGGGGGAGDNTSVDGRTGGSGGGGGYRGVRGTGTVGQGYDGWHLLGVSDGGGGGSAAAATSSAGGTGTVDSITGTSVTYGVGGNGGSGTDLAGVDGTGNGGSGGYSDIRAGRKGGSGKVVVRYADTYRPATATVGSPTYTIAGGYRIYEWTTVGSIGITF